MSTTQRQQLRANLGRATCWRRAPGHLGLLLALALAACAGPLGDAEGLRRLPSLEYSVWMTGGAFYEEPIRPTSERQRHDPYVRTFVGRSPEEAAAGAGVREAIPLDGLAEFLRRAEVFVRFDVDARNAPARAVPASRAVPEELLQQVREAGHDLVLVVDRLEDGPIEDQGINERWPVTLLTWLGLGLGMVIPDRTFESRASLSLRLVDPWSGRVLWSDTFGAGPVELALIDRGTLVGLVLSIVVPPFWVYSDRGRVGRRVRNDSALRMALGVARRLKRPQIKRQVDAARALSFAVERAGESGGLRIVCESDEALSFLRARQDGEAADAKVFGAFEQRLLDSQRSVETVPGVQTTRRFRYQAVWTALDGFGDPELVQLLGQTVAGRVGSATVRLRAAAVDR